VKWVRDEILTSCGQDLMEEAFRDVNLMEYQISITNCDSFHRITVVGNLPEGYIPNVPLPRIPQDQSTFKSRVPHVHTIPGYYKDMHVIPTYNSTCRSGERVATGNSPQWQPLAINS
jgi:hypothetical protein